MALRPYGTQEQLERRRQRAIELLRSRLNPLAAARGIGCSLGSVYPWRLLVGLGWSCQKPQKRARERNGDGDCLLEAACVASYKIF